MHLLHNIKKSLKLTTKLPFTLHSAIIDSVMLQLISHIILILISMLKKDFVNCFIDESHRKVHSQIETNGTIPPLILNFYFYMYSDQMISLKKL